jgi:UDP-N-acetylglucosamine 4-epimerase
MKHDELNGLRILLTGGAGFIGSNLAKRLVEEGAKVHILDNLLTGSFDSIRQLVDSGKVTFTEGDICDVLLCSELMKNSDVVVHQAALGSVPRSIEKPMDTHAININGFFTVLDAARHAGIKRFIYASSSSVYGSDTSIPKIEIKTGQPLSPYAVTKVVNEQYARVYSSLYGMEIIGLRYFNVFGPNQNPSGPYAAVVPLFISQMLKGIAPTIYGDGLTTRDFTYVENVVEANIAAIRLHTVSNTIPHVYNIAYGATTTLVDLYKLIAELTGFSAPPQFLPERRGDIRQSFASIDAARTYLGYRPVVDIKTGLEKTVRYFEQKVSV